MWRSMMICVILLSALFMLPANVTLACRSGCNGGVGSANEPNIFSPKTPLFSPESPDFSPLCTRVIQSVRYASMFGTYLRSLKIMIIGDWRRRSTRKATKSHLPAIPDFSLECTGFFSRPLCVWMAYYGCHTGFFSRNTTFFSRNQGFTWIVQDRSRRFLLLTRGVQYVRPT